MRPNPNRLAILALVVSTACPSCIHIVKTVEEPKSSVRFSSAKAAQTFYDATYVPPPPSSGKMNMLVVGLPMPIAYRKQKGSQLRFNNAVAAADSNRDGLITAAEASNYSAERASRRGIPPEPVTTEEK